MRTICENTSEDTYFLDADLAYQTALAHNTIISQDGEKRPQVCYYDGQPFHLAPDNLIHLPAEKFSEYFQHNSKHIPTHIETALPVTLNTDHLQKRLRTVMKAVQQLQKTAPRNNKEK